MPTLYVLQGPDKGRTYDTPREPAVIGRASDHIQLTDNSASRRHAEIRPDNGSWMLVDLNSSNGTYLNGQRVISPIALKHGDQIKVGSTLLVFSGRENINGTGDPHLIHDLVDFDIAGTKSESSILSTVDSSQDSVILQPPETADAVVAWNVVYKIAETIGGLESVDAFLERVTDILFEHLFVDHLVLLTSKSKSGEWTPQVVRYRPHDQGRRPKIVTSSTIINHVVKTREGVLCANAMTDDRFGGDAKQDSIHRLGLRSIICVPIFAGEQIHAIFHLDCSMSHHTFTQEQLRLVVAIGRLAGLAIENIRLQNARMRNERLAATGETVAYLSHHIRNILQGMQGGVDVVELGLKRKSVESLESGWSMVKRNLDRIYLLALNMLTFSKDRQPKVQTAQLNKIVEDVISLVQAKADDHHVMLLPELEEMPAVPLDPEGIHQVAHNILLNAVEACPETGGRINITTRYYSAQARVTLTITDNGAGISPEDRERIFDPFHSSKGHSGTGLGLAAAKKIVNELHGEIEVESTIGEGTTIRVVLPAVHVRLVDSDKTHFAAPS
ncbi:MAG: FHA domain-containing protein [Planctomycetes bacterium]|nr:FHA domain-containing protein [Planctomycetota bacterium]MBI3835382.1 FHA domain-containing protein [Planctomycetota bacterium]